jgi:hypothetical protein
MADTARRGRILAAIAAVSLAAVAATSDASAVRDAPAPPTTADASRVTIPPEEDLLATLRPGHPRLFLTPDAVDDLRTRIDTDPDLTGPRRAERATDRPHPAARHLAHLRSRSGSRPVP